MKDLYEAGAPKRDAMIMTSLRIDRADLREWKACHALVIKERKRRGIRERITLSELVRRAVGDYCAAIRADLQAPRE